MAIRPVVTSDDDNAGCESVPKGWKRVRAATRTSLVLASDPLWHPTRRFAPAVRSLRGDGAWEAPFPAFASLCRRPLLAWAPGDYTACASPAVVADLVRARVSPPGSRVAIRFAVNRSQQTWFNRSPAQVQPQRQIAHRGHERGDSRSAAARFPCAASFWPIALAWLANQPSLPAPPLRRWDGLANLYSPAAPLSVT